MSDQLADFMSDQLADGRKFRVLALVDHFSRVSPGIAAEFSMSGERVVALLEQIAALHGLPKALWMKHLRGQRPGVRQSGLGCLGLAKRRSTIVQPSGEANGQRLQRVL